MKKNVFDKTYPVVDGKKEPSPRPPVVEFNNVSKVWNPGAPSQTVALDNLSFKVEDIHQSGEFIAIIGPSGCGKSTALNLLAGFREVFPPTSGQIRVRGNPIEGPGRDRGMIFQKYSSFPHMTVLQNVRLGLDLNKNDLPYSFAERESLAYEWIQKVGLAGFENKYPHQLSGGQQQRVAIARSLALKPKIILMDEPFSALDEPTRIEMQRLTVELWQEVEATIFLVTHSIIEAVYLGDRVWIFTKQPGKIAVEFDEIPAPVPGVSPLETQQSKEFRDIVSEVADMFRQIETGADISNLE